jgi:RNA polymerase sigma factor (sigma-70 family)
VRQRGATSIGRDEPRSSFVLTGVIARQAPEPASEPATFEAIYEAHQRDVLRYAGLMLRDPDEAADVTAEAFTRAWDAWTAGRGPTGRPLSWLLVITRRLIVDGWRRRRRIAWLPLLDGFSEPAPDRTVETDFWLWLDELAAALPARQREVLFLRYRRDLTDAEIAAILGLSPSGVRSLLARAIRSLRDHPELLR